MKLCSVIPGRPSSPLVAQMNLMLAWYCCILDVTNILQKVKRGKNNFGGLLLFYFSIFTHAVITQTVTIGSCLKSKLFTVENLKAC